MPLLLLGKHSWLIAKEAIGITGALPIASPTGKANSLFTVSIVL